MQSIPFELCNAGDKERPAAGTAWDGTLTGMVQQGDQDGDGLISYRYGGLDCDDSSTSDHSVWTDQDCDGVLTADDCNDLLPSLGDILNDGDCDGILASDDCDDTDPNTINDMDCDGAVTADDCDDTDPTSETVLTDGDCDGFLTADDCDDNDAFALSTDIDSDCDYRPDQNQIAMSNNHGCVLDSTGTAQCWGYSSSSYSAQQAPPSQSFQEITAGYFHSCGLTTSQTVACWGENYFGQAGGSEPSGTYDSFDPVLVITVCWIPVDLCTAGESQTVEQKIMGR